MNGARWCVFLLALSLGICACAHSKIRGTQIDDTEENRAILLIVEEYHRAVEDLDADAVLALVSPKYFEDNGNTIEADDYDYKGLSDGLKANFSRTRTEKK